MASTWTTPQFRELGMDCEINSYFDDSGDDRGSQPARVSEQAATEG